jgi:hypothetical protein
VRPGNEVAALVGRYLVSAADVEIEHLAAKQSQASSAREALREQVSADLIRQARTTLRRIPAKHGVSPANEAVADIAKKNGGGLANAEARWASSVVQPGGCARSE